MSDKLPNTENIIGCLCGMSDVSYRDAEQKALNLSSLAVVTSVQDTMFAGGRVHQTAEGKYSYAWPVPATLLHQLYSKTTNE